MFSTIFYFEMSFTLLLLSINTPIILGRFPFHFLTCQYSLHFRLLPPESQRLWVLVQQRERGRIQVLGSFFFGGGGGGFHTQQERTHHSMSFSFGLILIQVLFFICSQMSAHQPSLTIMRSQKHLQQYCHNWCWCTHDTFQVLYLQLSAFFLLQFIHHH